ILQSKIAIINNNDSLTQHFNSLQLGPDNKIYTYSTVPVFPLPVAFLYQINQPNLPGLQSDFQKATLQCDTIVSSYLPNFYDGIFTNHHKASLRIPTCISGMFDSIPFYD